MFEDICKQARNSLDDVLEEVFKYYGITRENIESNIDRIRIEEYSPVINSVFSAVKLSGNLSALVDQDATNHRKDDISKFIERVFHFSFPFHFSHS